MTIQTEAHTFACALPREARYARRHGKTVLVGLGCAHGIPEEEIVSYGLAGGLCGWPPGTLIDAVAVIDESGKTLWRGEPLGIRGAEVGIICGVDRVIDDPEERRALHEKTGADAVDMESHLYAKKGCLFGCIRAISDSPRQPLGPVAFALRSDGSFDFRALAYAFLACPLQSIRAIRGVWAAEHALHSIAL